MRACYACCCRWYLRGVLGLGGLTLPPPVILGVVFSGFFLLLSCFGGVFWVLLVLFCYCLASIATVLLEGLVRVASVCFSGSFRRGEGRNVSDGFFYYPPALNKL